MDCKLPRRMVDFMSYIENIYRVILLFFATCSIPHLMQAQPRRAILSVGWTTHSAITNKSCFNISVVADK